MRLTPAIVIYRVCAFAIQPARPCHQNFTSAGRRVWLWRFVTASDPLRCFIFTSLTGRAICSLAGSVGLSQDHMSRSESSSSWDDVTRGSVGRIVTGYEAKIVDAAGNEVSPNEMGTLRIK